MTGQAQNPFHYGREIESLVDRADEVARVVRVGESSGTLFLIGPRRFGKTSILKAAEARLAAAGMVVLRYDAEAFESVGALAEAMLNGALRQYASALDRAQAAARDFFAALKPVLSLDPVDGRITVGLGLEPAKRGAVTLLPDVLNGIEGLAKKHRRRALVILDEFQQVVAEAGERSERQIRAAVQTHHNVGYVFAGSSTRLLTDMVATSARAFWHLGDQLHLGPIPRTDFLSFLRQGLESAGADVDEPALERILDLSEDVPFNVQQLASHCWLWLRGAGRPLALPGKLTAADVDAALGEIVSMQHASYLQRWLLLSLSQKLTLRIVAEAAGSFEVTGEARRHGLPRTSMQRALEVLESHHFLWRELGRQGIVWRLEDPFLRVWLRLLQAQ